jgi:hypothetical protein
MIYRFLDQVKYIECFFEDRETAEAARLEAAAAYLEQEAYRFPPIQHVTINAAGDHTWRPVTDSDPNDGEYRVFNHITGLNEEYSTLSSAKARLEMLKQELLKMGHLDCLQELTEMPRGVEERHYEHMALTHKDTHPPDFPYHPFDTVVYHTGEGPIPPH